MVLGRAVSCSTPGCSRRSTPAATARPAPPTSSIRAARGPGARTVLWLGEHHPDLVPRYRGLYGSRAYAPKDYQLRIRQQVRELADRYHVGAGRLPPESAPPRGRLLLGEPAGGVTAHPALTGLRPVGCARRGADSDVDVKARDYV